MMTHKYEIKYLIEAEKSAAKMEIEKRKLADADRKKAQIMLQKIIDSQVAYTYTSINYTHD